MLADAEHVILENQLVIMAALTTLLNADNAENIKDMQDLLGEAFAHTEAILDMAESVYEGIPQ